MQKLVFSILSGLVFLLSVEAKDRPDLAISLISEDLKENADVVIRHDQSSFEIKKVGKGIYRVKRAVSILNEKGNWYADFHEAYSKLISLRYTQGAIYDKNGVLVKKIKSGELKDVKTSDGSSLLDDNRVKYYNIQYDQYPFTVEYEYEMVFDGLLYFPSKYLYENYNQSVQKMDFEVVVAKDIDIRIKEVGLPALVSKTHVEEVIKYQWAFQNLKAIKEEPMSRFMDRASVIYIAPNDFEIEGYKGSQATWKDFGLWNHKLLNDRTEIPSETVSKVKNLTAGFNTDYEKAKAIYQYVQDKTRYVSIQLGIGGWQPFKAKTVDELSYGDCKALTNYTRSLLAAVGIKSYYTLVDAGNDPREINPDFPRNQFTHAFLTLPLPGDTLWLECTSQSCPFGYNGTFTDDRDVLLISERGGEIIHTRAYDESENVLIKKAEVNLDVHDYSFTDINNVYQGVFYEEVLPLLKTSDDDLKKYMERRLDISSYEYLESSRTLSGDIVPVVRENIKINIRSAIKRLGNKLILTPNLLSKEEKAVRGNGTRVSPFLIRRSKTWIDSIQYEIPGGYKLASIPKPFELKSKFGYYRTEVKKEDDQVLFIRKRVEWKGTFPAEDYGDFYDYCFKVSKNDNAKVLLVEK